MPRALPVLLLLALAGPLPGQEDGSRATALAQYFSQDLVRGVKRAGSGVLVTAGEDWQALDIGARVFAPFSREPQEADVSVAFAPALSATTTLRLEAGEYVFARARPGGTRHSTTLGLGATFKSSAGIAWTLAYERDVRRRADDLEVRAAYHWPLTSLGAFLEFEAFAGGAQASDLLPDAAGPRISGHYQYFGGGVRLPYRIGMHTSILAEACVSQSAGQDRAWSPVFASGGLRASAGLGLTFDF